MIDKPQESAGSCRIAIIGAGIVGVSCALWLQRDGHDVVLIDSDGPAAGASYGNGGVLAASAVVPVTSPSLMGSAPRMLLDPNSPLFMRWRYLPKMLPWLLRYLAHANVDDAKRTATALADLLFDSLEQHQALAKGTPAEKWLKPSDYVFVYKDRASFEQSRFDWSLRGDLGFEWEEMTSAEFDRYDPVFKGGDKFAIRLSNHGHITNPGKYVEALAAHFESEGGEIRIAKALDFNQSDGRIKSLSTSAGVIDCDRVVVAAGAWSSDLAKKLGIIANLESERGYHIDLYNPSKMPRAPIMLVSGKFVITPMHDRLRCAGIVEFGGLKAPPSKAPFALLKRQIHQAIPGLTYDHMDEWMGHRPAISDSIPLIGPVQNIAGAYAAFGHHHIGLTGGPKTGKLIADMIAGRSSNISLAPFDAYRFS